MKKLAHPVLIDEVEIDPVADCDRCSGPMLSVDDLDMLPALLCLCCGRKERTP